MLAIPCRVNSGQLRRVILDQRVGPVCFFDRDCKFDRGAAAKR
jgi:hypothetical protein